MPSRYPGAVTQDWEPVVLHKSKQKSQDLRDPKAKFDAGSNKKGKSTAVPVINTKKLEEETEPAAMDRVKAEVRLMIQKARLEKKMSQADLAKQINERTQVVQEYENGKAVPNQAVLAKMEKVLGVKLRGKIGK
ncbi:Multiprotein-bridging factor 1c [Arabidopsis thaliana]